MNINKKTALAVLLIAAVFLLPGCSVYKSDKPAEKEENHDKTDNDSDGLYDYEEVKLGTNINKKDTDGDGLSDYDEVRKWNTDPNSPDTNGNGISDGEEIREGYDPRAGLDSKGRRIQLDNDSDGLGNADEKKYGTDPEQPDADGDGFTDKQEVDAGSDPLNRYK
jgi:hypothetical protein